MKFKICIVILNRNKKTNFGALRAPKFVSSILIEEYNKYFKFIF